MDIRPEDSSLKEARIALTSDIEQARAEAARRSGLPEMVSIKGDCFQMGSPGSENGRANDERQHRVCVDDFAIGKYEVTFAQYDKFANATNRRKPEDKRWGRGDRPVINVTWEDVTTYAAWLSKETGRQYRLPTEAEWEYAARAGSTTAYPWGNAIGRNKANCDGCGSRWDNKQTAPVGSFGPNAWGLHDTVGNVWEWTCSKYDESYGGEEKQCAGRTAGGFRVSRGGSWDGRPRFVRSADRSRTSPDYGLDSLGFRLARTTSL